MRSVITTLPDGVDLPLAWWGEQARIEIDLGCHKGAFLVGMAAEHPSGKFLGIDRQAGRVARTFAKIRRENLANAWAMQADGLAALRERVPVHSIAVIHVLFPDPWPKRRHAPRRLVNPAFLDDARALLAPGGTLRLMTDDAAYFSAMMEAVEADGHFASDEWDDGRAYPLTEFQRKFAKIGKPIQRTALRALAAASV